MKIHLMSAIGAAVLVAACGGGGGGDTKDGVDTSGTYQVYTTSGRHFSMTLSFTSLTYAYEVDGVQYAGKMQRTNESFSLWKGETTERVGDFRLNDNAIVGSLPLGSHPNQAFIASKNLVSNLADLGGGRFEVVSRDLAGTTAARWSVARVNAAASTMDVCEGAPTGVSAGSEPLSDPSACPAGTTALTYTLTPYPGGLFTQTAVGSLVSTAPKQVSFAKVGGNVVYMAAPAAAGAANGQFAVGLNGPRGDLDGNWGTGNSSLGDTNGLTIAAGTATFQGGILGGPTTRVGSLAAVTGSTNALRYTPVGSSVATGGLVLAPGLAFFANFGAATGDLTLYSH